MDIQNNTTCRFYFIEWKTKNPSNGKKINQKDYQELTKKIIEWKIE